MFSDDELLMLSGLQHFAFCRRQWALIHIEHQWQENWRTIDGQLFHQNAHDVGSRQRRGDVLTIRALSILSRSLGVSGQCDVVEFHRDTNGVPLSGEDGLWLPYPVEYKRGTDQTKAADALQLCGQALCLEEMLCCHIPEGALFYGETRRRSVVVFDEPLRQTVRDMLSEMHQLYQRGYTPRVKPSKACNACSLKELCLPALMRRDSSAQYLADAAKEDV